MAGPAAASPELDDDNDSRRPLRPLRDLALRIGDRIVSLLKFWGGYGVLCFQIVREFFVPPYLFRQMVDQVFQLGVKSVLLVAVTGLATGSVMALQMGYGLARFGGKLYVPTVVALAVLREMGPVFTSLLLAARIGSGIAAEVASMKVTQQVDAIRALGTSPVKRIVLPKLIAALIAIPLLTVLADFIGLFGAMVVSLAELNINAEFYVSKSIEVLTMTDLLTGVAKTTVFAYFIATVACWKGLNTSGGTQGVGETTTWTVVTCSIFIMVADFFLSKLFIATVYPQF